MQDSGPCEDEKSESISGDSTEKMNFKKLGLLSVSAFAILVSTFVLVTFTQVWYQSTRNEVRSVDAIVVLGAAQWDGIPSPVLKARLDHA